MNNESLPKFHDHFVDPRNVGEIDNADGIGEAGGSNCGDFVRLFIKVSDGLITRVTFKTIGCPAAIATSSAATELATGLTLDGASMITADTVEATLGGLPAEKRNCSNLGSQALQAAIEDYISRKDFGAARPVVDSRVAVAMSGGVDSSAAAGILKNSGYDVIGLTMRLHDEAPLEGGRSCCSPADITDARSVANGLGLPHYTADFRGDFAGAVIDRFCAEYLAGRTPNPCMDCNRMIKFNRLIEVAAGLGAGLVATGHYVRITFDGKSGRYQVKKAFYLEKDQSYMFWAASQKVLSKLLAPLGGLSKKETRRLAGDLGLVTADKPESQEICFIPDNDYRSFLKIRAGYKPVPGPIVNSAGKHLGDHSGLPFYTIGQRRGLGLAHTEPLYVTAVNLETNTLVVGVGEEFDTLTMTASETNYIAFDKLINPLQIEVKYRYNMDPVAATISPLDNDRVRVDFEEPQQGVAPGQSAVFYDGAVVVGGGVID